MGGENSYLNSHTRRNSYRRCHDTDHDPLALYIDRVYENSKYSIEDFTNEIEAEMLFDFRFGRIYSLDFMQDQYSYIVERTLKEGRGKFDTGQGRIRVVSGGKYERFLTLFSTIYGKLKLI